MLVSLFLLYSWSYSSMYISNLMQYLVVSFPAFIQFSVRVINKAWIYHISCNLLYFQMICSVLVHCKMNWYRATLAHRYHHCHRICHHHHHHITLSRAIITASTWNINNFQCKPNDINVFINSWVVMKYIKKIRNFFHIKNIFKQNKESIQKIKLRFIKAHYTV